MSFQGFKQEDFQVFTIPGLENRMEAIVSSVRPKLEYIGQHLAPTLSALLGEPIYYHVAKHARRTVNPPNDTWVAWSKDSRGYKKHPHFQCGLWSTHLFIWFALIYESPLKGEYAKAIRQQLDRVRELIPDDFKWSWDHTQPTTYKHGDLTKDELLQQLNRVQNIQKAEMLIGITIDQDDPLLFDGDALLNKIQATFERLAPLYTITRN